MARLEENTMVLEEMTKAIKNKPAATYEEMVTFQLSMIVSMLADISKSLAVIANNAESEEV